jgi:hypothetical protein
MVTTEEVPRVYKSKHMSSTIPLPHANSFIIDTAVIASSFSTGPPGDRSALHSRWNAIATQSIRIISVQARGILPRPEEQSRTCGCQSDRVEDQPQCPGL